MFTFLCANNKILFARLIAFNYETKIMGVVFTRVHYNKYTRLNWL